jgi:hypothetical protein
MALYCSPAGRTTTKQDVTQTRDRGRRGRAFLHRRELIPKRRGVCQKWCSGKLSSVKLLVDELFGFPEDAQEYTVYSRRHGHGQASRTQASCVREAVLQKLDRSTRARLSGVDTLIRLMATQIQ